MSRTFSVFFNPECCSLSQQQLQCKTTQDEPLLFLSRKAAEVLVLGFFRQYGVNPRDVAGLVFKYYKSPPCQISIQDPTHIYYSNWQMLLILHQIIIIITSIISTLLDVQIIIITLPLIHFHLNF